MTFAYKPKEPFLHSNILYILTDNSSSLIVVLRNINWIIVYKYKCYIHAPNSEIADDKVHK